jgi:hypothetical protein
MTIDDRTCPCGGLMLSRDGPCLSCKDSPDGVTLAAARPAPAVALPGGRERLAAPDADADREADEPLLVAASPGAADPVRPQVDRVRRERIVMPRVRGAGAGDAWCDLEPVARYDLGGEG